MLHRPLPGSGFDEAFEEQISLRVVCGYALSESPYGLIWRHAERPFGTLGSTRQHPALSTVDDSVVDDKKVRDVATGEVGELLLRNPTVTRGYWRMPEQTDATVVGGWLHTGDLVTADADGNYTYVSRVKKRVCSAARPEPLTDRGRGCDRGASRRAEGGRTTREDRLENGRSCRKRDHDMR